MTNPNDAIGTNAGYNGRTTPNAFNDSIAHYTRGILSGWACSPKTAMTVQLGGDGTTRDVAIAEDNAGNKTTINNRNGTPVEITISAAPATGNRIDLIVAYADNPATGSGATSVDFQDAVGIIVVSGTAASTPTEPSEADIRTAITADGATGASAYYVVLASIYVGQGVTTIGSGVITAGATSTFWAGHLTNATVGSDKLTANAVWTNNIANGAVTSAKIDWTSLPTKPFANVTLAGYTAPNNVWTNKLSLDVTNIPTGVKFTVILSFFYRAPAALGFFSTRIGYNSTYGGYAYSSQPTGETLNGSAGMFQFTKVAGQNTVWIQCLGSSATVISDGALYTVAIF